jgi:hypothetical protein
VPAWFPEKINWMLSDEYHAPIAEGGHVRIYSATELAAKLRAAGLDLRGHHRAHALHSPYWWLKCAVGPRNNDHPLVVKYREFLEWDIMKQPTSTRIADRVLSPAIGKSIVFYGVKNRPTARSTRDVCARGRGFGRRGPPHAAHRAAPGGVRDDPWFEVDIATVESRRVGDGARRGRTLREAERAYEWLVDTQLPLGGWYAYYGNDGSTEDDKIDTNVCATSPPVCTTTTAAPGTAGSPNVFQRRAGTRVRAVDAPQRRCSAAGGRDRRPAVGLRPADRHGQHPAFTALWRRLGPLGRRSEWIAAADS